MKFNEIEKDQWPTLKPYLDTCLLPLTGLKGHEDPTQTTAALELLRDVLEAVEIPYRGRVVTYPAIHYIAGGDLGEQLNTISLQLKHAGFRFVIALTLHTEALHWKTDQVDLMMVVDSEDWTSCSKDVKSQVSRQLQQLWQSGN